MPTPGAAPAQRAPRWDRVGRARLTPPSTRRGTPAAKRRRFPEPDPRCHQRASAARPSVVGSRPPQETTVSPARRGALTLGGRKGRGCERPGPAVCARGALRPGRRPSLPGPAAAGGGGGEWRGRMEGGWGGGMEGGCGGGSGGMGDGVGGWREGDGVSMRGQGEAGTHRPELTL